MNSSRTRAVEHAGIAAAAVLALVASKARGGAPPTELWMVRTCRIGSIATCPVEAGRFDYLQLDGRGVWTRSSREAFFDSEVTGRPTIVFAHGGFTDDAWATHLASGLSCVLSRCGGGRPVRVVLWRWPSERSLRRLRPALQVTVARADFEGRLLARWLRQFDRQSPPILVGYSAGCRVIAGSLSRYAAGDAAAGMPARFRAVLVAPAIDADSLRPGRASGKALDAVETLLVTRHQHDRVLRFYPRLYPGPAPHAMGLIGVACPGMLGPHGRRVESIDLTPCTVGRHDFLNYLSAPTVAARLAGLVFAKPSVHVKKRAAQ